MPVCRAATPVRVPGFSLLSFDKGSLITARRPMSDVGMNARGVPRRGDRCKDRRQGRGLSSPFTFTIPLKPKTLPGERCERCSLLFAHVCTHARHDKHGEEGGKGSSEIDPVLDEQRRTDGFMLCFLYREWKGRSCTKMRGDPRDCATYEIEAVSCIRTLPTDRLDLQAHCYLERVKRDKRKTQNEKKGKIPGVPSLSPSHLERESTLKK
ncbi:hypothetical protein BGW80DRAFT_1447295 [Lactifluus volemus]|nr:hypothetical protein BGW80DRAFT_1447295 [Lactifluus volemus]